LNKKNYRFNFTITDDMLSKSAAPTAAPKQAETPATEEKESTGQAGIDVYNVSNGTFPSVAQKQGT
jgi:hypothetical protein